MLRTFVKSSNIISIGYDDELRMLEIEFKSGLYRYLEVPRRTYDELMGAESIGKYFIQKIRNIFKFVKV